MRPIASSISPEPDFSVPVFKDAGKHPSFIFLIEDQAIVQQVSQTRVRPDP
jgi:hypothetical protein